MLAITEMNSALVNNQFGNVKAFALDERMNVPIALETINSKADVIPILVTSPIFIYMMRDCHLSL